MRALDYSPYYRATVGFERMFDLLDSVASQAAGNGYPRTTSRRPAKTPTGS
jgi:molecular chaperone IbpA